MSSASYHRIPSSLDTDETYPPEQNASPRARNRALFHRPEPPLWQRLALIAAILSMFWVALTVGAWQRK